MERLLIFKFSLYSLANKTLDDYGLGFLISAENMHR